MKVAARMIPRFVVQMGRALLSVSLVQGRIGPLSVRLKGFVSRVCPILLLCFFVLVFRILWHIVVAVFDGYGTLLEYALTTTMAKPQQRPEI